MNKFLIAAAACMLALPAQASGMLRSNCIDSEGHALFVGIDATNNSAVITIDRNMRVGTYFVSDKGIIIQAGSLTLGIVDDYSGAWLKNHGHAGMAPLACTRFRQFD